MLYAAYIVIAIVAALAVLALCLWLLSVWAGSGPAETAPVLWVNCVLAAGGENVSHIGEIDLSSGTYTPDEGACAAGILDGGGGVTTVNGAPHEFVCAMGSTIAGSVALQP